MFIYDRGVHVQIGINMAYVTLSDSPKIYQQSTIIAKFLPFIASYIGSGLARNERT